MRPKTTPAPKFLTTLFLRASMTAVVVLGCTPSLQASPRACSALFEAQDTPALSSNSWAYRAQKLRSQAMLRYYRVASVNYGQRELRLQKSDGGILRLKTGRRLGLGWVGSVYDLKVIDARELPADTIVIKFPHALRWGTGRPLHSPAETNEQEAATFELIQKTWSAEGATRLMPLIPILATYPTRQGLLLLKPKVKGIEVADLLSQSRGQISPEFIQSLKDLYTYKTEIEQQLKTDSDRPELAFLKGGTWEIDINPRNLVWLSREDVARLESNGVHLPFSEGLALFELGLIRAGQMPPTAEAMLGELRAEYTHQ